MKQQVVIIAEAGVNHNGDLEKAKELVKVAAKSGADFVKFQTFKAELNVSKSAKKAAYQEKTTGSTESQYEMVKKLELSFDSFQMIEKECKNKGIGFLSTGFDFPSLDFLETLNPQLYKIPSGEITNLPYLRKIASFKRPIVMSTGMASLEEVREALNVLVSGGVTKDKITIVHCNTEYPTPMEDVNLKAMNSIGENLGVKIGYSDHTLGIEVPIAAVALGATVIEKHFTLDRNMKGPDHAASLEPEELKAMVTSIRNIEKAIAGSGKKEPSPSEEKNKEMARKSIFASKKIRNGEELTADNLMIKRTGIGINPMKWDEIIGTKAKRDYDEDEMIEE